MARDTLGEMELTAYMEHAQHGACNELLREHVIELVPALRAERDDNRELRKRDRERERELEWLRGRVGEVLAAHTRTFAERDAARVECDRLRAELGRANQECGRLAVLLAGYTTIRDHYQAATQQPAWVETLCGDVDGDEIANQAGG